MDHAEAHERIIDLALEPEGLDRLGTTPGDVNGSDDEAFAEHVRGCPACGADLAAARALRDHLDLALAESGGPTTLEPITPPGWLRDAVLEAARREPRLGAAADGHPAPGVSTAVPAADGRARGWPERLFGRPVTRWAAGLAAVAAIALVGGLVGSAIERSRGDAVDPAMVAVVATLDRVLAAPDHRVVSLASPQGAVSGTVAWSAADFAVLTSSLTAPPAGQTYQCWLEWAGRWAPVGVMEFAGATAYWTGPAGEWASVLAEPGTRFVVTLESATGVGDRPAGATVLVADLGA